MEILLTLIIITLGGWLIVLGLKLKKLEAMNFQMSEAIEEIESKKGKQEIAIARLIIDFAARELAGITLT